jgi:cell division protease FtsH
MGAERRSMVMTEHEKELTAYHEAGHALVGLAVPGNDPLHKVPIIPRRRPLGVPLNLPERDRYAFRKNEIEARLAMMFGGRVAEQLVFGPQNVTTGAANDIQQATDMARRMVTEWGMSEALGRLRYSDNEEEIFLGRSITRTRNVSEDTSRLIDSEVRHIIEVAEAKARLVLNERLDDLHAIARALLEYETLSGDDAMRILRGERLDRSDSPDVDDQSQGRRGSVPNGGISKRPGQNPTGGSVPGLQPQG